jgi:hypothetical protein
MQVTSEEALLETQEESQIITDGGKEGLQILDYYKDPLSPMTNAEKEACVSRLDNPVLKERFLECETLKLSDEDMLAIKTVWSKKTLFSVVNTERMNEALEQMKEGYGRLKAGGLDLTFEKTNSFLLRFGNFQLHVSTLALVTVVLLIFGVVALSALVPGVLVPVLVVGPATLTCTLF